MAMLCTRQLCIFLSHNASRTTSPSECQADVVVCLVQDPKREPDPEHIEEDQVYPEIHEITSIQIGGTT